MFPYNLTLAETTEVTARHNEALGANVFIRAERGPFVIFNYLIQFPGAFPDFTGFPDRDREVGIIRECRGLTFYAETGLVASRKFHKFHNLNGNPETMVDVVDFSRPHVVMDKLDGSMITPALWNYEIEWHTKMGKTDVATPVAAHVANLPQYDNFARDMIGAGFTPIFEWTSRQQRIVIDYPEDQLVLLHVRDNETGVYSSREELNHLAKRYNIPLVKVFDGIKDIHEFIEHTRVLVNVEGYVVQFVETGLMLKLKAEQYCMLHNSKEQLNLEKNAIALILSEESDDLLPQLDAGDRDALVAFSNAMHEGMGQTAKAVDVMRTVLLKDITEMDPRLRRKQYAARVMELDNQTAQDDPFKSYMKGLLFRGYEVEDLMPDVRKLVATATATQTRVDEARVLFGDIFWKDYRGQFDGDGNGADAE